MSAAGLNLNLVNAQQASAYSGAKSPPPPRQTPTGQPNAPPPPAQPLDLTAFQNAQASSLGISALRAPTGKRRHLAEVHARLLSAVRPHESPPCVALPSMENILVAINFLITAYEVFMKVR